MAEATAVTKIWMALKAAVGVASGGLPIAWPGQVFDPAGRAFLAVAETRGAPERRSLRGSDPHRLRGVLIIRLSVPAGSDQQPEVWREAAAEIGAQFPADRWLDFEGQRLRVRENAEVGTGYRDGGWWHIPVSIKWETSL